jgi:hypothetical protein
MNLQDFHTLVRDTCKRGSSLDHLIPHATRQAARHIERNFTLQYMRRYQSFPIPANVQSFAFPSTRFKQVSFIRIVQDDGSYDYLTYVDPQEVSSVPTEQPTLFWLDGFKAIWFNAITDKAYSCHLRWIEYTNWPTGSGDEPWLLAHAEDCMLAATMVRLAPQMRDPEIQQMYSGLFDLSMKSLIDAEMELQASPARNERMNFGKDMA